jgi:(p)ppGpp synthase/HD superfamily hydrolase
MTGRKYTSEVVRRAAELAKVAHAGQYRRDEATPYIRHPKAVASRVAGDESAEAAAWLHDVLEDTHFTSKDLRKAGIPEEIVACVILLTKKEGATYEHYLSAIKKNPLAKKVKVADMLSNLADRPSERQIVKYAKGLLMLLS